jgi:5-formyltetrahydrofolate cyclo-ligase
MTKAEIRRHIATLRPDFQTLEKMSLAVIERFQTLEIFKSARAVGAYMPLADEVDVTPLFQALEKTFYIPAFDEALGMYRMARLTAELKKGHFGIPEPAVPDFAGENEIDLILVPGVAFDRAGRRIGRGGGFYDRILPQYRAARAGICFDFQCLEPLPAEKHDVQMNWLGTETQILKIAMNS